LPGLPVLCPLGQVSGPEAPERALRGLGLLPPAWKAVPAAGRQAARPAHPRPTLLARALGRRVQALQRGADRGRAGCLHRRGSQTAEPETAGPMRSAHRAAVLGEHRMRAAARRRRARSANREQPPANKGDFDIHMGAAPGYLPSGTVSAPWNHAARKPPRGKSRSPQPETRSESPCPGSGSPKSSRHNALGHFLFKPSGAFWPSALRLRNCPFRVRACPPAAPRSAQALKAHRLHPHSEGPSRWAAASRGFPLGARPTWPGTLDSHWLGRGGRHSSGQLRHAQPDKNGIAFRKTNSRRWLLRLLGGTMVITQIYLPPLDFRIIFAFGAANFSRNAPKS
jgi:hypothetical protein